MICLKFVYELPRINLNKHISLTSQTLLLMKPTLLFSYSQMQYIQLYTVSWWNKCCSDKPGPRHLRFVDTCNLQCAGTYQIGHWCHKGLKKQHILPLPLQQTLLNYQPNFFSMHFGFQNFKKELSLAVHSPLLFSELIVQQSWSFRVLAFIHFLPLYLLCKISNCQ